MLDRHPEQGVYAAPINAEASAGHIGVRTMISTCRTRASRCSNDYRIEVRGEE